MQFATSILFVLTTLAIVQSIVIPKTRPDGTYSVSVDENGHEIHTRLDGDDGTNHTELVFRGFYADDYTPAFAPANPDFCSGNEIDHAALDAANADLDKQCDGGAKAVNDWSKNTVYAKRGNAIAYFCITGQMSNSAGFGRAQMHVFECSSEWRGKTSLLISAACGKYKGRFSAQALWGDNEIRYGYARTGEPYCPDH